MMRYIKIAGWAFIGFLGSLLMAFGILAAFYSIDSNMYLFGIIALFTATPIGFFIALAGFDHAMMIDYD